MTNDSYDSFISRAYVDPIRSVLVVDDDFPTYNDILTGIADNEDCDKKWKAAPDRVQSVIRQFRERAVPLLVDIHDGKNVPADGSTEVALHLHQSDLLVLDYELDRTKQNDGSLAIETLRSVATNRHFNLVIVYTSLALEKVFQEVRIGLLSRSAELPHPGDTDAQTQELLDQVEVQQGEFVDRLLDSIDEEAYLEYRLEPCELTVKLDQAEQPFSRFHDLCVAANLEVQERQELLTYALCMRERKLKDSLSSENLGNLTWGRTDPYWIQSESVFVAFAHKGKHDALMERLSETLGVWAPPPSRLLLSRLRAEIDEQGIAAQEHILGRRRALALWYSRLLTVKHEVRLQHIADSVNGHAELLLDQLLSDVSGFANELIDFERASKESSRDICVSRFAVDLNDQDEKRLALAEHNVLVCSRPVGGRHLTTGHVFIEDDDYWICLTPSCDLVPGQGSKPRRDRFGEWLPFMAVKLHPDGRIQPKEEEINDGRCVFLDVGAGTNRHFLFTSQRNAQPEWRLVYAKACGLFLSEQTQERVLTIASTKANDAGLAVEKKAVVIVAQLRYEYALNLLHKLGGSLSRIGLDFVGKIQ